MSDKKGTMWGNTGSDENAPFMHQFERSSDPNSIYAPVFEDNDEDEEKPSGYWISGKHSYSIPEDFFNKKTDTGE